MKYNTRRDFIASTSGMLVAAAALGISSSNAADEHAHHGTSADGLVIDAAQEKVCATCQFWGGMRKIQGDGKQVAVQSMGWCNNPHSPNHQKLTPADHQMTKAGIWQRWGAL